MGKVSLAAVLVLLLAGSAAATKDSSEGTKARAEALSRKRVTDRVATIVLGAPPTEKKEGRGEKKGK